MTTSHSPFSTTPAARAEREKVQHAALYLTLTPAEREERTNMVLRMAEAAANGGNARISKMSSLPVFDRCGPLQSGRGLSWDMGEARRQMAAAGL